MLLMLAILERFMLVVDFLTVNSLWTYGEQAQGGGGGGGYSSIFIHR